MRFRSLVISWCFCAIHCSVQTSTAASGHRSLDETSRRSSRHPLSDVEIPPDVLLERRRSLRGISESPVASFPTSSPSRTDDRENIVDRFVLKRHSPHRKRRKKCNRRKQDARRKMRPEKVKFADEIEESESSMKLSSIVKSSSTFDAIKNAPTSTLSPTRELTTESSTIHFTDTTTNVVSSTRVAATVVGNDTTRRRNSQRNPLHKKCRRTKCATGDCKEEETRIIDLLEDEFFPLNAGESSASQTSSSSSCTSSSSHRLQDRSRQDNHEYDV